MSPKIILWISFSVISSTWYALDPDARLASGFSVADNATTQMEQMILTD